MDYEKLKCPVCDKAFQKDEDIVVCPDCGTPQHRECYDSIGHCINKDKHKDGYVFGKESTESANDDNASQENKTENGFINCPNCKAENPDDKFYCSQCGHPLGQKGQQPFNENNNQANQNNQGNQYNGMPFGGQPFGNMGNMGVNPFDPMGGVNPEYKMDENVTAGEAAKLVQRNTPYFMRVFYNIKEFGRGRFSFSAFLFSGGYLLYRKMYKIGAVITAIIVGLMLFELYAQLTPAYSEFINMVYSTSQDTASYTAYYNSLYTAFMKMNYSDQIIIGMSIFCSVMRLVIQIIVGLYANRWYFNHTVKTVTDIKNDSTLNFNNEAESKGGINNPLAISMMAVYFIISYLPMILTAIIN